MSLLIDSHVHIYPNYDIGKVLQTFRMRIAKAGAQEGALCLVEREGVSVFNQWAAGQDLPPDETVCRVERGGLLLKHEDQPDIAVLAGRQIVCAENVEILALGLRESMKDGLPAASVVEHILRSEAQAVLAWGVGKWLFSRKKVVDQLIRRFCGDDLYLGDSSLRPLFWGEPDAMVRAPSLGRRVLHGSDPLPPTFEQTRIGQYGDLAETSLGEDRPVRDRILCILRNDRLQKTGKRANPIEFARRMLIR